MDVVNRRPGERILFAALAMASLGGWLYRLALPLAVFQATHSAEGTAIMYTLEFVPFIILGPLAGTMADRLDRRWLLVAIQAVAALWAEIFGLIVSHRQVGIEELFVFGGILSCSQVFFQPGFNGLLPMVVSVERLGLVNARIQTIQSLLTAIGPAFGSIATVGLGLRNAMLLDGAFFALTAILLLGLRRVSIIPSNELSPTDSPVHWNVQKYFKSRPDLLYGIVLFAGTNFGLMAIESNIIFIVAHDLVLPDALAGVVLGIGGIGAVIGSLAATRLSRHATVGRLVVISMVLAGVLTLCIAIPNWIVLAIVWALISAAVSIIVVVWLTFQEQTVPSQFLGRLTALGTMASFAAIPAGAITGSYLIGAHGGGLPSLALVAGGVQVLVAGIGYFSPLWHAGSPRTDSANLSVEP